MNQLMPPIVKVTMISGLFHAARLPPSSKGVITRIVEARSKTRPAQSTLARDLRHVILSEPWWTGAEAGKRYQIRTMIATPGGTLSQSAFDIVFGEPGVAAYFK